jgi:hypothetical protein
MSSESRLTDEPVGLLGHLDVQSVYVLPDHAADEAVCPEHGEIPECRISIDFPFHNCTYVTAHDWGTYVCPECDPSGRYVNALLLAAFEHASEREDILQVPYSEGSDWDNYDDDKSGWKAYQISPEGDR